MIEPHIVGYAQLEKNARKQLETPEDCASMASGALRSGNDFYQVALCYGIHNPRQAVLGTAVTCNLVFAAELYLKTLIYRSGRKPPRGHNLERLFEAIDENEQSEVIASCLPHLRRQTADEFMLSLREIGNAFSVLRYSYERTGYVLDFLFVLSLAEALHDLANKSCDPSAPNPSARK